MPRMQPFYSVHESKHPVWERVYHNNRACSIGRAVPIPYRQQGMNDYKLCEECKRLNQEGH